MSKRENAVLFVPGYYGSELVDPATNQIVWVTAQEALLGKNTLALPISGIEVPGARELAIGRLVEQVSLIPAYGFLRRKLQTIAADLRADFHAVPIDWRREPLHGAKIIDAKIKELKSHGTKNIYLISHSLGSAITAYYLRYGTQEYSQATENWEGLHQVKKAVLAAAPFFGLMVLFRNLMKGLSRGGNKQLLSPLAVSSFESTYYFTPKTGYDFVFNQNLETVSLNLSNPESWRKNRFGLFNEASGLTPRFDKEAFQYTKLNLDRAQQYHHLLQSPLKNPSPHDQILYIQAVGRPTVEKGVWLYSEENPNRFVFYEEEFKREFRERRSDLVNVDGDGTVPTRSSQLPIAFQQMGTRWIRTTEEHLECLQNERSLFEIQKFLHQ